MTCMFLQPCFPQTFVKSHYNASQCGKNFFSPHNLYLSKIPLLNDISIPANNPLQRCLYSILSETSYLLPVLCRKIDQFPSPTTFSQCTGKIYSQNSTQTFIIVHKTIKQKPQAKSIATSHSNIHICGQTQTKHPRDVRNYKFYLILWTQPLGILPCLLLIRFEIV